MCVRVYYVSPKGSAQLVAQAIAGQAGCPRQPLLPAYKPDNLKLMFIGCEKEYDKVTDEFILSLNSNRVKNAAIFYCGRDGSVPDRMRRALESRGISVMDITLQAPCRGLISQGPDDGDLERARTFARDCIKLADVLTDNKNR